MWYGKLLLNYKLCDSKRPWPW